MILSMAQSGAILAEPFFCALPSSSPYESTRVSSLEQMHALRLRASFLKRSLFDCFDDALCDVTASAFRVAIALAVILAFRVVAVVEFAFHNLDNLLRAHAGVSSARTLCASMSGTCCRKHNASAVMIRCRFAFGTFAITKQAMLNASVAVSRVSSRSFKFGHPTA
jgi:hypothetical protein